MALEDGAFLELCLCDYGGKLLPLISAVYQQNDEPYSRLLSPAEWTETFQNRRDNQTCFSVRDKACDSDTGCSVLKNTALSQDVRDDTICVLFKL